MLIVSPASSLQAFIMRSLRTYRRGTHAKLGLESLVELAWRQVACGCQLRDGQRFGELVPNQAQRVAQALLGAFRPVFSINNACVSKLSDNLCVLEVAQRDLCRRRLEDLAEAVDNQLGLVVDLAAFQHGDVIGMNGGRQTLGKNVHDRDAGVPPPIRSQKFGACSVHVGDFVAGVQDPQQHDVNGLVETHRCRVDGVPYALINFFHYSSPSGAIRKLGPIEGNRIVIKVNNAVIATIKVAE